MPPSPRPSPSVGSRISSFMLGRDVPAGTPSIGDSIKSGLNSAKTWASTYTPDNGSNLHQHQKRGLTLLFLLCLFGAVHYELDYHFFGYTNNIFRTLLYAVLATVAANILMPGFGNQKGTVIAIWKLFIYVFLLSIPVYAVAPSWMVTNGGAEILIGILAFGSVGVFPKIYSKDPIDAGFLRVHIFTCYLLPFIGQGIFFQLFSSSVFTTYVPQLQSIMLNYITPMFLPIWLFYFAFFQDYIEKPFWLVLVLIGLILLFSSPLWIDYYNGGIQALGTSGVSDTQKNTAVNYLTDVGTSGFTFARERWNATTVAVQCWWYDFTGQISSISSTTSGASGGSGSTSDSTIAALCKKPSANDQNVFEASVDGGSLSFASMSLSSITAAQQKYYQSQDSIFMTTLKYSSINAPLNVAARCVVTSATPVLGQSRQSFDIEPSTKSFVGISGSSQQDLICTVPQGRLRPGSTYELNASVTFDYLTSAYITRYFTTETALNSFSVGSQSQADNLLSFYSVSDKQPVSKSTKGPIKVGINAGTGLIVFNDPQKTPNKKEFTVIVSIENQNAWKGKIQTIQDILLALPKGLELKSKSTSPTVVPKAPTGTTENPNKLPTWSNYECSAGGFVGNFQLLSADQCLSLNDPIGGRYGKQLDCAHYTYYLLQPGYDSGSTAIAVAPGLESKQKSFVSCQAVASDAKQLLPSNANFATKSIQAIVDYTYSLQQTTSFKVESVTDGSQQVIADSILSSKTLCKTADAYSLVPNLGATFFYDGKRDTKSSISQAYDLFIAALNSQLTTDERSILGSLDCPIQSIALANIWMDWSQVKTNPMVPGSYGYLRANKDMVQYLVSKQNPVTPVSADDPTRYTDATKLDMFLKANSMTVATAYLLELTKESQCNDRLKGTLDYACIAGKLRCGNGYLPQKYTQCSVTDCQACEMTSAKSATNLITLATQIGQMQDPFLPAVITTADASTTDAGQIPAIS